MKELEKIFTDMLDHVDDHREAYSKKPWTNNNIVKAWLQSHKHKIEPLLK